MIEFMEKNMVEGKTIESEDNKLAHNHTVINQWTTFSEINQHVMARVKKSISAISELTENKTIELSQQFQSLSNSATEQTNRIVEMSHLAKSIVIDGQEIEISEITRLLQETF